MLGGGVLLMFGIPFQVTGEQFKAHQALICISGIQGQTYTAFSSASYARPKDDLRVVLTPANRLGPFGWVEDQRIKALMVAFIASQWALMLGFLVDLSNVRSTTEPILQKNPRRERRVTWPMVSLLIT